MTSQLLMALHQKKIRTCILLFLGVALLLQFFTDDYGLHHLQQHASSYFEVQRYLRADYDYDPNIDMDYDMDNVDFDRKLSKYLGVDKCEWTPPNYDVPDTKFWKTLIAGFPSGDKRLTFIQLEALTGLPAKDEWDFQYQGMSNHPFIKANYPHHEGIWGWQDAADQTVMVVRNIRRSMVEYHDILFDIDYAKTYEDAILNLDNLYSSRPPLSSFMAWRDERVLEEIDWYGWFIDYYMENGLQRDMFTKKTTTPEHWNMLMQPTRYRIEELSYDANVGNDTVVPNSYDPNCQLITNGCRPVQIISAERLVQLETGPAEGRKIAELVNGKEGFESYMIPEDAWECVWRELIVNRKGIKTFRDREGLAEYSYNFSEEMLVKMIAELQRLIDKYGSSEWEAIEISAYLVELLTEHRDLIEQELDEVRRGDRVLRETDFLGPSMRRELQRRKEEQSISVARERTLMRKEEDVPETNHDFSHLFTYLKAKRREKLNEDGQ